MKLACSSTAFHELLSRGDLTQLEWLDWCARDFDADGAVVDLRHFPRTDTDYLAQIKKMAADTGLVLAALRHDGFFTSDGAHAEQSLEIAGVLGAPLLSAPLPPETACSWDEMLERVARASGAAKARNITLAVRNAPHTMAGSTSDLKRVAKEADSAWLRFGPDFAAFEPADEPASVLARSVMAYVQAQAPQPAGVKPLTGFRGFITLDAPGTAGPEEMKNALRAWRKALFEADRT